MEGWDFHPNYKEANKKRFEALPQEEKKELLMKGWGKLAEKSPLPPDKPAVIEKNCRVCGKKGKLCSGCHTVAYCTKECQSKDWSSHKPDCFKNRSYEDKYKRWTGKGLPTTDLVYQAMMEQGGDAEYLKKVTAVRIRSDLLEGGPTQYEVDFDWEYDANDKGSSMAMLELNTRTNQLLLKSWNWSPGKDRNRFQAVFKDELE